MPLGRMGYLEAWDVQKQCVESVLAGGPDVLILVEHPPVMTLGASFHEENLLLTREEFEERGVQVVRTDRGGDVTYHGPGQLVVYPIYGVDRHGRDLHKWMRDLEETMILTCASFGLDTGRNPPHTGCWIQDRKIASIGVKVRRWVSQHGIALNCCNDMAPFDWIVPCGIQGCPMTSLTQERGEPVALSAAAAAAISAFSSVFSSGFGPDEAAAAAACFR